MGEADTSQGREHGVEVLLQGGEDRRVLIEAWIDLLVEAIDGLIAAEEDPIVCGQSQVVELVAAIADSPTMAPAD